MTINIQLLSDLHLEFEKPQVISRKEEFVPPALADVLILAGDIQVGTNKEQWFLATLKTHKLVLYFAGNHEYYHNNFVEINKDLPKFVDKVNNLATLAGYEGILVLLQNEEYIYEDVRFLGGTLWTSFNNSPTTMLAAEYGMNDFRIIKTNFTDPGSWESSERTFRPQDAQNEHFKTVEFLEQKLAEPTETRATVVATHHGPSMQSVHNKFVNEGDLNYAYASALDDLVEQTDLWVHGHTHESLDYELGKSRVVCNPRGYVGHAVNHNFNPNLVLEV